ncbi:MAG: hypothetical protein QM783_03820 [Phycisphaerales bacterium]
MPRLPLLAFTVLALSAFAGGCNSYFADDQPLSSRDEYNYRSTPSQPQTVVLRDLRTEEVLRTWEIPVDQKLFVRFLKGDESTVGQAYPDECECLYYPITMWNPPLEHRERFKVPPSTARRLELFVRPGPELPGSMKPADVPMPPGDLPPVK